MTDPYLRLGSRRGPLLGPSRHFVASQQFGRFRSEADISLRFAEPDL